MNATTQSIDSQIQPTGESETMTDTNATQTSQGTENMTNDTQLVQEADAVPDHIARHDRLRDAYLEKRKDLQTYVDRIRRNRKGAASAREEAETSDTRWRELLRENDGEVTREVRQLKRAVTDNRETAEELEAMASELQKDYETRNVEVIEARKAYLSAVTGAREAEYRERFNRAIAAIVATPEGQALIDAMGPLDTLHKNQVRQKYADLEREIVFSDTQEKAIKLESEASLPLLLASRLEAGQDASKRATSTEADPLESLKTIPQLDCERDYDGPDTWARLRMRTQMREAREKRAQQATRR